MGIEAYLIMDVAAVPRRKKHAQRGPLLPRRHSKCPNPIPAEICKRNQRRRINYTSCILQQP
jgi:hypothetical protein